MYKHQALCCINTSLFQRQALQENLRFSSAEPREEDRNTKSPGKLSSSAEIIISSQERAVVVYVSANGRAWCSPWPPRNSRWPNKKAEFPSRGWEGSSFCTFRDRRAEVPARGAVPYDLQIASWCTTQKGTNSCVSPAQIAIIEDFPKDPRVKPDQVKNDNKPHRKRHPIPGKTKQNNQNGNFLAW